MLDELRRRTEGLADWLDRHTYGTVRPSRLYLGKTYSGGSFPTAAGRVYLTHPMAVAATESEGSTPTFTVDASSSVPVLVLDGPLSVNDYVVAKLIGGLWIAEKGQGTPTVTFGFCTVPLTLNLSWVYAQWGYGGGVWTPLSTTATLSTTLSWVSGPGYFESTIAAVPSDSVYGPGSGYPTEYQYYKMRLSYAIGTYFADVYLYNDSGGTTLSTSRSAPFQNPTSVGLAGSCSPFSFSGSCTYSPCGLISFIVNATATE